MEEENEKDLPEDKTGDKKQKPVSKKTTDKKVKALGEQNISLEKEVNKDVPKEQIVDTSDEGAKNLGSKPKGEAVQVGSEAVTTFIKFDEKAEAQVRDLLQKELKVEVQEIKKDFLIIFGLFASFVTFISINVQVFKNNDNTLELIGICSISLSFIIFFALIINGIVKQQLEWSDLKRPSYIINLTFLIIGVVFIACSEKRKNGVINELQQSAMTDSIKIDELKTRVIKLQEEINRKQQLIDKNEKMIIRLDSIISKPKTVKPNK
ncbi:hypothetical protein QWY31_10140 [Cytophagales bacterium LB-30]|uniref:Uncharacterized protein n=1 Tax=Shiella aurantiaca TaxID=3058365 RepID=A0ABT8F5Z2_9BACT|nr:hypothetical protein [Shiella aurantiaca]MDN4165865.1 hypothetical protein [Shiella aurantiaca]